ncbi:MAG: alpha-L-arabinofuranosidase C-terminal domain-containing protein [Pyrinomonadaceae bacterium]
MEKFTRRQFLGSAAFATVALPLFAHSSRATDSRIDILLNESIGTINPNIYGHFVEHLGAVVYDGIWVGENSKIPNYFGIRKDLVDALKRIKTPVIRYPGGCFADSYDWRDGIGDRTKRPIRTNFWQDINPKDVPATSTSRFEPNTFGTNEFIKFCQMTGAWPYMAANLRSLPAQVFNEWVEYCNSPKGTTTYADTRAKGSLGSENPFNVSFWGIGNESWGCGGNFTPDEYAQEFRRYTAAVATYGVPLKFIGAGAESYDMNWTRGFFAKMHEKGESIFRKLYGWGIHHYSWNVSGGRTTDWNKGKGDALKFDREQYFELLNQGNDLDDLIKKHWAIMGEYDKTHRAKIIVDEWGSWHAPGTELKPEHLLGQQNTMRDALLASLSLDIFNRNADKVAMANIAQLVNCLQSLFLADADKFLLTPTYHVFDMFTPHMGAEAVRTVFSSPSITYDRNAKTATFWGLQGSASKKGNELTLTVTNPHPTETRSAEISLGAAKARNVRATVLAAADTKAHNTFERPTTVAPREANIETSSALVFNFAPASVTKLSITLS